MGTPDFAVPTLAALLESRHEVVGVVTQPDRPKGRSGKLQPSPVKEKALEADVPVLQPEKVKDPAFLPELEKLVPDVIVVVAFGQILPESVLNLPKYGCMNVHASLLPKLRGANTTALRPRPSTPFSVIRPIPGTAKPGSRVLSAAVPQGTSRSRAPGGGSAWVAPANHCSKKSTAGPGSRALASG